MKFFGRKLENFSSWKNKKNMVKECFFGKKRLHLFKSLLYKNEKVQIMPVVAGGLVYNIFKIDKKKLEKI